MDYFPDLWVFVLSNNFDLEKMFDQNLYTEGYLNLERSIHELGTKEFGYSRY